MGERLSPENAAVALLANSLATGLGLFVLILILAPISGAHLNPIVTLFDAITARRGSSTVPWYVCAQLAGAVVGAALANVMFDLPPWSLSAKSRAGTGVVIAEVVASAGLLATIAGTRRYGLITSAAAIAAYLVSAYWFTASTSFANPAVTIARAFSPTFAGIAPANVGPFILAQLAGGLLAVLVARSTAHSPGLNEQENR
jgi:glycerol uptake facilitator-like aquaporin